MRATKKIAAAGLGLCALGFAAPAGASQFQIIWGPGGVAITAPSDCPNGASVPCSWLGYMNEPDVPKTVGLGPIPPGLTFDIAYPDFCGVLQADVLYKVDHPTDFYALGSYWQLLNGTRDYVQNCTAPTTTTTTTTVPPTTTTTEPPSTTSTTGQAPPVTTTTASPPKVPVVTMPTTPPSAPVVAPVPPKPVTEVDGAPIASTAPQLPYTGVPVGRLLAVASALLLSAWALLRRWRKS